MQFMSNPDNTGKLPKGEQSKAPKFEGTREEWLTMASHWIMQDMIKPESRNPDNIPEWRVSVGHPKGVRGGKNSVILGVCHPSSHSSDGHCEVFITPMIDDSVMALATLAHEMCHVENDCREGHKGGFKRIALAIGLTGKMTETVPTEELREALEWWIEENGAMPHAAMLDDKRKRQSTRMKKVTCEYCNDYTVRGSAKVLNSWLESGNTLCPCCQSPLTFDV